MSKFERWRSPVEAKVMSMSKQERINWLLAAGWKCLDYRAHGSWQPPYPWDSNVYTLASAIREDIWVKRWMFGLEKWCYDPDCEMCADVVAQGELVSGRSA